MQHPSRFIGATALLLASPAWPSGPALTFARETAVVLDQEGTPLLEAPRSYLLEWAGNPAGKAFEIDKVNKRVRVTPDGAPALWLRCADLLDSPCGPADADTVRSVTPDDGQEPSSRTLPICPGDPRCPR